MTYKSLLSEYRKNFEDDVSTEFRAQVVKAGVMEKVPIKKIAEDIGHQLYFAKIIATYGVGRPPGGTRFNVKQRVGNRCSRCRKKGKLHAHHIGDSTIHKEDNLIILCPKCHGWAEGLKNRKTKGYRALMLELKKRSEIMKEVRRKGLNKLGTTKG